MYTSATIERINKKPALKRMQPYHRLKGLIRAVHPKGEPVTKPNKNTNPLIQNGRSY